MPRKQAEIRVRDITNHYGWYRHKYGDVRYCIHCHSPLPKTEKAPDFFIAQIGNWIEAKNNDSTGTWRCAEIMEGGERSNQREFLNENGGWLFIELSDGRGPKHTDAYLVPWERWKDEVEPVLIAEDMKSFRRETILNKDESVRRLGADVLLRGYGLEWETHVGWTIPSKHIFWQAYKLKLEKELQKVNKEISKCQTSQLPLV